MLTQNTLPGLKICCFRNTLLSGQFDKKMGAKIFLFYMSSFTKIDLLFQFTIYKEFQGKVSIQGKIYLNSSKRPQSAQNYEGHQKNMSLKDFLNLNWRYQCLKIQNLNQMKKVISFLLLLGVVLSYIVSIDSCTKYGPDGRQCLQCVAGFQLLNKSCYPKVKGCAEYDIDGQCSKCERNAFLVGGKCCDGACFEKLLKKNSEADSKYSLEDNYQRISKLIETAENELPDDILATLIQADRKEFNGVERWFFLYKLEKLNTHYQRIVVDYNNKIKNPQNTVVDSSFARIPDEFSLVQWKEIENTQAVLKLFPSLYAGKNFKEVSAKIAILSEIKQFQIEAISEDIASIRVLYQLGSQIVVLKDELIPIGPNSKLIAASVLKAVPSASQSANTKNTSKVTYQGVDIQAELDVNEPLIAAVNLLKQIPNWDYTLKVIQEEAKTADVVKFLITAENSKGVVKAEVSYSRSSGKAKLIEYGQQAKSSAKPVETASSTEAPSSPKSDTTVHTDGCTTHTSVSGELKDNDQKLVNKLLKIREESVSGHTSDGQTPIIGFTGIGKNFRRVVTTEICTNSGVKQYAYVQTDKLVTTREYFSYYIEYTHPQTGAVLTVYTGTKNKTQSTLVFNNPKSYPPETIDPSFIVYPTANMFQQPGMIKYFLNNLTVAEAELFVQLQLQLKSQRDRQMELAKRFTLNSVLNMLNVVDGTVTKKNVKVSGTTFKNIPNSSVNPDKMLINICEQGMNLESQIIGSKGLSPGQVNTENQEVSSVGFPSKVRANLSVEGEQEGALVPRK